MRQAWSRRDFEWLRECSPADLILLVEAALWLGVARAALLTIPFRWTTRLFALNPCEGLSPGTPACISSGDRIFRIFRAAAARTPWENTCLVQALAGSALMRVRGIPATMSLGVAKEAGDTGALEAHAWLTCGDVVLTGASGRERYQVIAQFRLGKYNPA